ncbi:MULTISPECIES: glycosyltransferase family 4 protein [unclassified Desulfovibrio]|uniref:glycosyltransferase family 4 protein n=1 Tax=unclassified Desulfovibrio TaxID=2593640 RepID=UPI0013ECE1ED|nr:MULTISPECIES: glycosyltransferase family 4 protein [unclassified Desulfovibrio]
MSLFPRLTRPAPGCACADPGLAPLPPGLPHVAYVLLWYPLFTQPFIFREVEALRERLPLTVHTLYGRNLRHCSDEMQARGAHARPGGIRALPRYCLELLRQLCTHPVRLWRLFRRSCWRRWQSWEVLGENLWAFLAGLSLGREFREGGIDLVYAPWPRGAATAAWVAASVANLPFATAARGDNLAPADPDLADKFAAAVLVRANNAADKARIEAFGAGEAAGKTALVYNGLTLPAPGPEVTDGSARFLPGPLRLLAVGRFDVTKGFDVLLRACALLKQRGLDFRLTLAGGGGKVMGLGNMEDQLRRLRTELGLAQDVDMPGLISHNELPGLLAGHDIFLAPCVVHASGRRDGIPNTVIEAMAYGLPVVGTTVNALPEVIRHGVTGLAVPPDDAEALADAVLELAEDPARARAMGRAGARLAKEMFDAEANADRLAHLFRTACEDWRREQGKDAGRKGADTCAV